MINFCQRLAAGWWFSPGTPVPFTNRTYCQYIIGLWHEYWWILSWAVYHIAQACERNMIYCEGQYSPIFMQKPFYYIVINILCLKHIYINIVYIVIQIFLLITIILVFARQLLSFSEKYWFLPKLVLNLLHHLSFGK